MGTPLPSRPEGFDCLCASIRIAYREACNATGTAASRWAARDEIARIASEGGLTVTKVLRHYGLDLDAYAATCPTTRPAPPPRPDIITENLRHQRQGARDLIGRAHELCRDGRGGSLHLSDGERSELTSIIGRLGILAHSLDGNLKRTQEG